MEIEPGTVVANRYRISRAIGRGGMGEVFAAENIRTGRPVAVKLLRADSKSKSSAVERFRREARAAGSINSDHVTQVLDVEDDTEHGIVIVFELLEGESLIDRLKRTGPIPFDELHPIIEEVWVGLSDAHKVGIIHRDLKPSNVFLERRPDGHQRVKILDFGISKLPKEMGGETLTEMGQSLGTFSFMPPEQIGRAKTVDHRADIYATTTMIYQSLTGQLPYVARNILVMVELKSKTNPRPLSEALGHPVDPALEQFVATGLARNPADRFQNALEALEKWHALKSLRVPESRRAVSMADLNAQARNVGSSSPSGGLRNVGSSSPSGGLRNVGSSSPSGGLRNVGSSSPSGGLRAVPLPAAGRPASGAYPPAQGRDPMSHGAPASPLRAPASGYAQAPTGVGPAAQSGQGAYSRGGSGAFAPASSVVPSTGMGPPALVVPVLDPVMPAALPRLYDQTESTTDGVSHIELVNPKQPASGEPQGERQGPQGTRVMPPTVVQQAVAAAEARKASRADLRNASAAAQAQSPSQSAQAQPHSQVHSSQQPHSQVHSSQQPHSQVHSSQAQPQGVQQLQPPPTRQTGAGRPVQHAPSSHPPALTPQPAGSQVQPPGAPSHAGSSALGAGSSAPPPGPTATSPSVPSPDPRLASQAPQSPRVHMGQPPPLAQVPTPFPGVPAAPQPTQASYPSTPPGSQSGPPATTPSGSYDGAPGHAPSTGIAAFNAGGPAQLSKLKSTMKLPDEPASPPANNQDKTTVYRANPRKPEKKQSNAVFVIGAIVFAIVGFGIVFVVQYLVKTLGH